MNKVKITLGDWSDDGHGKYKEYILSVNINVKEMQEAYKKSCRKLKISFNHNEDFTGVKREWKEAKKYQICCEYQDNCLSEEVVKILKENKCPLDLSDPDVDEEKFIELLMWFIQQSLPELRWKIVSDPIPNFNGWWNHSLNIQLGYGLFD